MRLNEMVSTAVEAAGVVLAAIGLSWALLGACAAGAVASFLTADPSAYSVRTRASLAGFIISAFSAPAAGELFDLGKGATVFAALVIAMYAVPLAKEFRDLISSGVIKEVITNWIKRKGE